jgi:hypothetical protein
LPVRLVATRVESKLVYQDVEFMDYGVQNTMHSATSRVRGYSKWETSSILSICLGNLKQGVNQNKNSITLSKLLSHY